MTVLTSERRSTRFHRFMDSTWLPVKPTYALRMGTPAASEAAATEVRTASVVAAASETSPRRRPVHGATPMPAIWTRPSAWRLPTTVHTFVVPMSMAAL